LYAPATQVVFGAGPTDASVILVGEQPGDAEDRAGEPFVGPAGRILDKALVEAGIERESVYVTNAVKHFSFVERGKRRLHQTPQAGHVTACRPWLAAELAATTPQLVVALGAIAGRALAGPKFRVTRDRGELLPWPGLLGAADTWADVRLLATIHPSAVLRAENRDEMYEGLVADLRVASSALE
jgi:DNA polymerase